MPTGLLSNVLFANHVNLRLVKLSQRMALTRHWRPDTAPAANKYLLRPCSGTLAIVGKCGCHSHSKFNRSCHLAAFL